MRSSSIALHETSKAHDFRYVISSLLGFASFALKCRRRHRHEPSHLFFRMSALQPRPINAQIFGVLCILLSRFVARQFYLPRCRELYCLQVPFLNDVRSIKLTALMRPRFHLQPKLVPKRASHLESRRRFIIPLYPHSSSISTQSPCRFPKAHFIACLLMRA